MNRKQIVLLSLLVGTFLMTGCGMHYNIKGRVIDAATEQPVEGAVVAIYWIRYLPGLPRDYVDYGTSEFLTDENGSFDVPKYVFGEHSMGVYKKGYVCWSSETIFNPEGKTREEMYTKRPQHRVASGMVIELEPIVVNELSYKHASFAMNVRSDVDGSPIFSKAISDLRKVNSVQMQKSREEMIRSHFKTQLVVV